MKAHQLATLTVAALIAACSASNAPVAPPEQPNAVAGAEDQTVTTTGAQVTGTTSQGTTGAQGTNTQKAAGGNAASHANRESTEDHARAVASPPHVNNNGSVHGVQPQMPVPRPINTGDPCGWCRHD
jgi:hypothetical protein